MKNDFSRLPGLFLTFFKISAVTVGGGLTMIPVMEREFIEKRKWITGEDMVDSLALVQSMPGVIAVNMAIIIGYRTAKLPGALVSALGVAIPPFLAILVIASLFRSLSGNENVENVFRGVRAAVCALILLTAVSMGKKLLKSLFPCLVAGISFCIFVFLPDINAVLVIIAAGLAGLIYAGRGLREKEKNA